MRKFFLYFIPVAFLIISFSLMISGGLLKEPFGANDDLLLYVENIESYVKAENWEEAKDEQLKARDAWKTISRRIQYSVERDDMMAINESLSRIQGGLEAEDTATVYADIYNFYWIWEGLG